MWPFSSQPQGYLGVDIGSYGIKLVELHKKNKRSHLFTYAYSGQKLLSDKEDTYFLDIETAGNLLKQMCAKAKVQSKMSLASLPASAVYNFLINIPAMKKEEEADFIRRQAQKFLPIPINDVMLDWKDVPMLNGSAVKGAGKEVLFTAAPKKIIAAYSEIFKKAGLTLLSMESETFSLISALIGKDPSPILIVDFGAAQTDFIMVENGIPTLFHSINLGGQNFTELIQQNMGVDVKEAEQIKRDLRNETEFPAIFEPMLKPIDEAVRYAFQLYSKQKEQKDLKADKIILTGGSALLPHLDTRLSAMFNMKVYLGDPWARVIYDESLKPVLDAIGPRFAVALGLTLKKIES